MVISGGYCCVYDSNNAIVEGDGRHGWHVAYRAFFWVDRLDGIFGGVSGAQISSLFFWSKIGPPCFHHTKCRASSSTTRWRRPLPTTPPPKANHVTQHALALLWCNILRPSSPVCRLRVAQATWRQLNTQYLSIDFIYLLVEYFSACLSLALPGRLIGGTILFHCFQRISCVPSVLVEPLVVDYVRFFVANLSFS